MPTKIAEAFVETRATVDKLKRDLRRAEADTKRSTKRMSNSFQDTGKAVRLLKAGIAAIGVGAGVRAFRTLIANGQALADSLDKTSQRLGVNVEALQEWRFAADQSGIAVRQFDIGLQRFLRRVGEAQRGGGELRQTLIDLGVSFDVGREGTEVFEDFLDALSRIPNSTQRLAAAFKGFDSEGVVFLQLLSRGADGLEDLRKEARELGLVLSGETIAKLVAAKDAMSVLDAQTAALGARIGAEFAGEIIVVNRALGELIISLEKIGILSDQTDFSQLSQGDLVSEIERIESAIAAARDRFGDFNLALREVPVVGGGLLAALIPDVAQLEEDLIAANLALKTFQDTATQDTGAAGIGQASTEDIEAVRDAIERLRIQRLRLEGEEREAIERTGQLRLATIERTIQAENERAIAGIEATRLLGAELESFDKKERERQARAAQARTDEIQEARKAIASTFADLVLEGESAAERLRDAFIHRFIEQVALSAINRLGGLFNLGGGGGGVLGALFGTIGTAIGLPAPVAGAAGAVVGNGTGLGGGGGGAGVEIVVSSPIPMQATTQAQGSTRDPVRVLVEAVAADTLRGGANASAIEQRFGVSRSGVRR